MSSNVGPTDNVIGNAGQTIWVASPRTVIAHMEGDASGKDVPYDRLGQLIVLHNMLEVVLSMLLVTAAGVRNFNVGLPVISSLDFARKCELLKSLSVEFPDKAAKMRRIANLAERIGKGRNNAAHGVIGQVEGLGWVIHHMSGAKSLRQRGGAPLLTVADLAKLSRTAADLVAELEKLRADLERVNAARETQHDLVEALAAALAKTRGEDDAST